jgi:hypothetical protein
MVNERDYALMNKLRGNNVQNMPTISAVNDKSIVSSKSFT